MQIRWLGISPSSQHRLRLVCFPSSVLRNLQMQHQMRVGAQECQRPKSAWSGSSIIQDTCTKPDFDLSQTRFSWTPPRLRSIPLGPGDSSDFQPNQRECHRACGEGTWLRWFLFGGSERRRCCSQFCAVCRKETSKCLAGTLFA